ncbi:hypothetical protein EMCRGX_G032828 [Ephydatia muelleri]
MNTKISLSPRRVKLIEDCIVASRHMSTIAPKFVIKCVKKVAKPASEIQQVNVSTEQSSRVAALETKFDEFVIRIEAAITKAEPAVTKAAPVQHASQVDIAIKEAISANDNRYHVVISGLQETESPSLDIKHTKEIVSSLDIGDDVVFVDAYIEYRLGKRAPDGNRPRLLKVRFASSLHRSLVLRKAKSLKNSPKYSKVYIRPCHSPAERKHLSELYSALHDLKQKTGKDHYIDRRGPVKEWSVKMRIEKELSSATVNSS